MHSEMFNPADYVRVTNKDEASVERGKKLIRGRFNGKDYVFPYGKPVDVPIVAAMHIFGFGMDDKSQALARLGWARTSDEVENAMARMKEITFADLPAMMEVPRDMASGSVRPLGKTGEAAGDEQSSPNASAEVM